jgi:hypothetical protein
MRIRNNSETHCIRNTIVKQAGKIASWTISLIVLLAAVNPALAQYMHDPAQETGAKAGVKPALLDGIRIDQ